MRLILSLIILLILGLRLWLYYSAVPEYTPGQKIKGIYKINSEPQFSNGRQHFRIKDEYSKSIKVYTSTSPRYNYADTVFIDGIFTIKNYKGTNYYYVNFPNIQTAGYEKNILTKSSDWIRNKARKLYESHLPPISSSLILGIIFGGKHGMPQDFEEKLQVTGAMHVIAASGMNVTFVAGFLITGFSSFLNRRFAVVFASVGVIYYMFLAGLEPSIVRAGTMALLAFGAALLGKQYYGLFALFLTLIILLLISPGLLVDVGFQLSFLSTLGIILFKPGFFSLEVITDRGRTILKTLLDDIGTTIAAQVGALPVMLSVFGSVGILSVLVNALVLWTIPVIMTFGAISLIAGLFIEPIGVIFLYLCLPFLLIFEKVIVFFGGLGLVYEVGDLAWQLIAGYYLIMVTVYLTIKKSRPARNIFDRRPESIK